jgi:hypothetical protein
MPGSLILSISICLSVCLCFLILSYLCFGACTLNCALPALINIRSILAALQRARSDRVALSPHPVVLADVGFACAGGSASHGQWPQQAGFRSVVVGILGNGHQLDRIYSTWLPELSQGHVYLMVDACEHATTSLSMHRRNAKTHAARDGPAILLVRHHPPTVLPRPNADKTLPPASRRCRTASRRRGTASQSARPSPLRARAGCGCRGSTEQTPFGYHNYAKCPKLSYLDVPLRCRNL